MNGLDCLGCDEIGFDWMQLAKGGAAALEGAGDFMSMNDKSKKGGATPPAPPPPPQKSGVGMGTIAIGVVAAVLGVGGIVAIARK